MSELEDIKADIARTKLELGEAKAKDPQNPEEIAVLRNILLEQQRKENFLLQQSSSASAGAPIVIFHPFICTTILLYVFPSY